jgi:uncharacterized protein YuzE
MESGRKDKMNILYNDKVDLLYIRLDERKQEVINKRISEDIVLDIGLDEKVVGIEIFDASKHVNLERLLPIKYETKKGVTSY